MEKPPIKKNQTLRIFFMGFVSGLIVAVIVAFFVARSPFKAGKVKSAPDAELKPSAENPNAGLYGKSGLQAPNAQPPAPPTKYGAAAAPQAPADGQAENVAPQPGQQNQQPQQQAAQNPNDRPAFIQAGAFSKREEADNMRGRLALMGFRSTIVQGLSGNRTVYRVRLGPFNQKSLDAALTRLHQNGVTTSVTRHAN